MKKKVHFRGLMQIVIVFIAFCMLPTSCKKETLVPGLIVPNTPDPVPWTVVDELETTEANGVTCANRKVKYGPQHIELTCFDPQGDVIFPGQVIKYESINNGGYTPIAGDRTSITISASLPNLSNGTAVLDEPSLSSFRQGSRNILQTLGAGNTPAQLGWKIMEIYSKKHFDLAAGGNYGNWFLNISAEFDYESDAIVSRYLLEFEQVYYSIDVDTPEPGLENWFEAVPNSNLIGSYSPVYVSSVKYGRKVFFLIESREISSGISAELKAEFSNFAQTGNLVVNSNLDKLLKSNSIKAYIMGGSAPEASLAVTNPATLKEYINKGANYSENSPGVPLSYTLRFIKDNSVASLNLYDEFQVRECFLDTDYNIVRFTPKYTPNGYIPPYGGGEENPKRLYPSLVNGNQQIIKPKLSPRCSLYISDDKKKVMAWIEFKAEGTDGDNTVGEGKWPFTVYTAPANKAIESILSKRESRPNPIIDTNGGLTNTIEFPPNSSELVRRYSILGETEGSDLGNSEDRPDQTNIRVWFNEVKLKLKDL